jgi:YidC/Oxa1 family membrane protein insertase
MRRDLVKFFLYAVLFLLALNLLSRMLPPPKRETPKESESLGEAKASPATAVGGFLAYLAQKERPEQPRARATPEAAAGGFLPHLAQEQQQRDRFEQREWQRKPAGWHQLGAAAGPVWAATGRPLPRQKIDLGSLERDPNFHLYVEFDPRGASVRRIVLNKFKSSDRFGKPVDKPFALVPDQYGPGEDEEAGEVRRPEEYRLNSNVLYHYDVNDADASQPLDTLGRTDWEVVEVKKDSEEEQRVSFATTIQGVRITKTFTLPRRGYHLGLEVKLQRTASAAKDLKFRYQLSGTHGLPIEGRWYTGTFRNAMIGLLEGNDLWRYLEDIREIAHKQGGDPQESSDTRSMQYAAVTVQFFASAIVVDNEQDNRNFLRSARATLEAQVVKLEVDESFNPESGVINVRDRRDNKRPPEKYALSRDVQAQLQLLAAKKGDRISLLVVPDPFSAENQWIAIKLLRADDAEPVFQDDITVRVNTGFIDLPESEKEAVVHKYLLYNGPIKVKLLGQMTGDEAVPDELVTRYKDTLKLYTLTDYPSPGFWGGFGRITHLSYVMYFFTNLCHDVLGLLHRVFPLGICIVILTVLVRGMMFPLSRKQARTSLKMQELAPELKRLKEKFKDDRQAFAMAQMELFRKHGVNPLGTCWMLLLQMPIFMGLYFCLQESVFFRLAGFLWIENLAAPDMFLFWSEKIPLISRPQDYGSLLYLGPFLNILPILAVSLMIYQQRALMPPPADEQQAMQMKIMKYMMIFFGLMFYKVAAGLCIYFIASSLWGFAERKWLPKKKPGEVQSADNLLQQMQNDRAAPRVEQAPAKPDTAITASNRAKRRQERKKRQERAAAPAETTAPAPSKPVETNGWWSNMRRKVRDWWKDVLKKAAKK